MEITFSLARLQLAGWRTRMENAQLKLCLLLGIVGTRRQEHLASITVGYEQNLWLLFRPSVQNML